MEFANACQIFAALLAVPFSILTLFASTAGNLYMTSNLNFVHLYRRAVSLGKQYLKDLCTGRGNWLKQASTAHFDFDGGTWVAAEFRICMLCGGLNCP